MENQPKKEPPKEKDENELAKGLIDDIIEETESDSETVQDSELGQSEPVAP